MWLCPRRSRKRCSTRQDASITPSFKACRAGLTASLCHVGGDALRTMQKGREQVTHCYPVRGLRVRCSGTWGLALLERVFSENEVVIGLFRHCTPWAYLFLEFLKGLMDLGRHLVFFCFLFQDLLAELAGRESSIVSGNCLSFTSCLSINSMSAPLLLASNWLRLQCSSPQRRNRW